MNVKLKSVTFKMYENRMAWAKYIIKSYKDFFLFTNTDTCDRINSLYLL